MGMLMSVSKRKSPPSRKRIAEHWLKKSHDIIMDKESFGKLEKWEQDFWLDLATQDWGEPACWACKSFISDPKNEGSFGAWSHAKYLEICHIIPHAMDGPNEVSNYVLLCSDCHKDAPNVADPSYMKRWITNPPSRNLILDQMNEMSSELSALGITNEDLEIIIDFEKWNNWDYTQDLDFLTEEFKDFYIENCPVVHFGEGTINSSSRAAIIRSYIDYKKTIDIERQDGYAYVSQ